MVPRAAAYHVAAEGNHGGRTAFTELPQGLLWMHQGLE